MERRPVVAELELGDARRRRVQRPDALERKPQRLQDQDPHGDAVGDETDRVVSMPGAQSVEAGQNALARLGETLATGRRDQVRRLGPAVVERPVTSARLVEGQAFPLAVAQLLEGRVRRDLETVRRRDRDGRVERAPKRARVDGGEGVFLELAGGRFSLDEAFRR